MIQSIEDSIEIAHPMETVARNMHKELDTKRLIKIFSNSTIGCGYHFKERRCTLVLNSKEEPELDSLVSVIELRLNKLCVKN